MHSLRYYRARMLHFLNYNANYIALVKHIRANRVILSVALLLTLLIVLVFSSSSNVDHLSTLTSSYSKNQIKLPSLYTNWLSGDESDPKANQKNQQDATNSAKSLMDQKINLFKSIFKNIEDNKPSLRIDNLEFKDLDELAHSNLYTEVSLSLSMSLSQEFLDSLKTSHTNYLKNLPKFDNSILNYKGNGVIILGGGDLTWLALLSTRLFRRMGGELPVHIMLPKMSDYHKDREICDKFLSQLNAKCVVITEKLGINQGQDEDAFFRDFEINPSMYKSLSILVSEFENVLYLESENFLLKPIDNSIFENQMFKENGELIIWPDFWKRKTSPKLYKTLDVKTTNVKVRDISLPLPKSLHMHSKKASRIFSLHDREGFIPDPSSDGAQILINKTKHWQTLLLTLYYNLYGYGYYYPLIDQTYGSAEKETFILAAHALGLDYYQVKHNPVASGFWYDNDFRGTGMLQFDPITDFFSLNSFTEKNEENPAKFTHSEFQNYLSQPIHESAMFLKVNYPPMYPVELFNDKFVVKENGDRVKLFGNDFHYTNENFELTVWRIIKDYICSYELNCSYLKKFTKGEFNRADFCNTHLENHISWLSGGN